MLQFLLYLNIGLPETGLFLALCQLLGAQCASKVSRGLPFLHFLADFFMFDSEIGIVRIELTVQFFVSDFNSQLKINIPSIIL